MQKMTEQDWDAAVDRVADELAVMHGVCSYADLDPSTAVVCRAEAEFRVHQLRGRHGRSSKMRKYVILFWCVLIIATILVAMK